MERLWKASRRRTTIIKRREKWIIILRATEGPPSSWRFSRTTASPAAITKSLDLKKKKERRHRNEEESTVAAWDIIRESGNFCTAEFRAKYANALKRDTRKNAPRIMCNFSHFTLLLCVFVLLHLLFRVESATHSRVNSSRQENGLWQMRSTCYSFSFANLCGLRKEKFVMRISIFRATITQVRRL